MYIAIFFTDFVNLNDLIVGDRTCDFLRIIST
jgi:hypothetical protein